MRDRTSPKAVLKSVGPRLVPFFKTVAIFFVIFPDRALESIWYCIFKCAPVASLMAFVLMHGMSLSEAHSYSRRILVGLILSCIGDIFLVWKGFFTHGLAFFAAAHLVYALAFGCRPPRWRAGIVLASMGVLFYTYLFSKISGHMTLACAVYTMVIGLMLWRAISRVELFNDLWTWTKLCSCAGALLFTMSDIVIALDRFCFPVPYSHTLIMLTYYAAQLGIALSVVDSHVDSVMEMSTKENDKDNTNRPIKNGIGVVDSPSSTSALLNHA